MRMLPVRYRGGAPAGQQGRLPLGGAVVLRVAALLAAGSLAAGCGSAHNPFAAQPTATATVTVTPTPTADPVVTLSPIRPTVPSSSQQVDASDLARQILDISPPRGYQWNAENTQDLRADIDQLVTLFDGTTRADEVGQLYAFFGAALDEHTAGTDSRRWWVTVASLITNGDQARSFEDPLPGYLDPNDHGAGAPETPEPTAAETTTRSVTTATADPDDSVPPSVPPTAAPVGTDNPDDFEEDFFDGAYQVPVELAPGLFEFTTADDGIPCRAYVYNSHHTGRAYTATSTHRVRVKTTDTEVIAAGCIFSRVAR